MVGAPGLAEQVEKTLLLRDARVRLLLETCLPRPSEDLLK